MKCPNIIDVRDAIKGANETTATIMLCGFSYNVPARPLGFSSMKRRFTAAWLVWTGHADALTWPGQ